MTQSNTEQPGAVDKTELFSVQIDTSLYTPGTDIDWATMAQEISQFPPGSIIVRIHLKPSLQWIERNKSQLVRGMAPYGGAVVLPHPSIFSEMWVAEAMRLITRLGKDLVAQSWFTRVSCVCLEQVDHIETSESGDIIAYWGDYCALAEEAFTAWMWDSDKDIPESLDLIPSSEWRAIGSSEYLTDSPMGALSGQYNTFLSEAVSNWNITVMKALSKAISAKSMVGLSVKGYLGGPGSNQRMWGIQTFESLIQANKEIQSVVAFEPDSWIPVDSLITHGLAVVGVKPDPNPQVAFLLHEASICWVGYNASLPLHTQQLRDMLREMKLSVWDGLVSDIQALPSSIKFVVVANVFALKDAELSALQVALRKGGRTFLLVGAVGLVNPESGEWSVDRMQSVTGIPFSLRLTSGSARCIWLDNKPFGEGAIMPRCVAKLAYTVKYEDGENANGQRWLPSGKLHWCACTPLHLPLWREWLAEAQVSLADTVSAEVQQ